MPSKNTKNVLLTNLVIAWVIVCLNLHTMDIAAASQAASRELANGVWGGDHVRMVVGDAGAELEFECARGSIEGRIVSGANGGFDVSGSYTAGHGGPRKAAPGAAARARYSGRVAGETMKMTVRVEGSDKPIGTFTLARGRDPLLTKCG
jgi:hypothetical protein